MSSGSSTLTLRAAVAALLLTSVARADEGPPAPGIAPVPGAPLLAAAPAAGTSAAASTAAGAVPSTAPLNTEPKPPPPARRRHVLGLSIDAGVPDFASVSVLYRPWKNLRFSGGMLYNYVGYGVRGGVSVLPYFPIAPSLNLDVGHYFGATAEPKVARFTNVPDEVKPLLQDVGYTFVNASLGLELGHPDWFVFFVRAGVSRVWLSVHHANDAIQQSSGTHITSIADPTGRFGIPNAQAGFQLFFY